jgi:hypothetical protein
MKAVMNINSVCDEIIRYADKEYELFITDFTPKNDKELRRIMSLLRPHVLVDLGGLENNGLHLEKYAIQELHKQAIVVCNSDKSPQYLANTFTYGETSADVSLNKTIKGSYLLHMAGTSEEVELNVSLVRIKNTLQAVVATSYCLGLSSKEIVSSLEGLVVEVPPFSVFEGDDETTIYACTRELSDRKARSAYMEFKNIEGFKILVWDKLPLSSKQKDQLYRELKQSMLLTLDAVITTDPKLYSTLRLNNTKIGLSLVRSRGIYEELRATMRPNAHILLVGEGLEDIVNELASND